MLVATIGPLALACGMLLQELDLAVEHPTSGHFYRPSTSPVTIDQALELARLAGGTLVSIETAEEHEWLRGSFGGQASWVGLEHPRERWASGAPFEYAAWSERQQPFLNDRVPFTVAWADGPGWQTVTGDPEWHRYHALVEIDHAPPAGPVVLPAADVPAQRAALLLVVDGLRAADLEDAKGTNLAVFLAESSWTFHAAASPDGDVAAGWGMLVWGVGPRKSRFAGKNLADAWLSSLLQRMERVAPDRLTAWIVDDTGLTTTLASGRTKMRLADERGASGRRDEAIRRFFESPLDPGCAVIGWSGALGGNSAQRKKALAAIDAEIGAVLELLRARPEYGDEDWLVILTSPGPPPGAAKGANGKGEALELPDVPLVVRGGGFAPGELATSVSLCDVVPTMERHLGLPPGPGWLDGRALQASAPRLGVDLLVNGGAEAQVGWRGRDGTLVPGWRCDGNMSVDVYLARGIASDAPGPEHRGRNHFGGTKDAGSTRAEQLVDVRGLGADIDGKGIVAKLSGWLGGYAELGHEAALELDCLNASGKRVARLALPPVGLSDRRKELGSDAGKARTGLLQRAGELRVPAGTRVLRVALVLSGPGRCEGALADEIALVLERRD